MSWGNLHIKEEEVVDRLEHSPVEARSFLYEPKKVWAAEGTSHESFLNAIHQCTSCPVIAQTRGFDPVSPKGRLDAPLIIVGRNPGRIEGEEQQPLSEKAPGGKMLNKYLFTLGVSREDSYITNALFCYTPNDRPPDDKERNCCSQWKMAEFSYLTNVRVVFLLGDDACVAALGSSVPSLTGSYGTYYKYASKHWGEILLVPILHPGSTLRNQKLTLIVYKQLELLKPILIQKLFESR